MRLLQTRLKSQNYLTIEFNPWRHETEDALWAAFMISFLYQVSHGRRLDRRIVGHVKLIAYRLDPRREATSVTLRIAGILVALVTFPVALWLFGPNLLAQTLGVSSMQATGVSAGMAWLIALALGWILKTNIIEQTESKLRAVLTNPEYEDRVSFIEQVHEDLKCVLDAYVGPSSEKRVDNRVFVFIDDLDRCDVPKSAQLMQALNLLLATDDRVVFLLGLDREKVAAGIAVKNENSLKYLAPKGVEDYGLTFGYNYLEKFIQIPFQVPQPRGESIVQYVKELLKEEQSQSGERSEAEARAIVEGWERDRVMLIVLWVSRSMGYNPRRIKRFLNQFRLRTFLAATTTPKILGPAGTEGQITLEQLGKFVAISLRWPWLLSELSSDPSWLADRYEFVLRRELRRRWQTTGSEAPTADADNVSEDRGGLPAKTKQVEADGVDNGDAYSVVETEGPLADLSVHSLQHLDELLLAGVYDDTPSGFENLGDEEAVRALTARFDPPEFGEQKRMDGGAKTAIEALEVEKLETVTGANREFSLAAVDLKAFLHILPHTPGRSEASEPMTPSSGGLQRGVWWLRKMLSTRQRLPGPYLAVESGRAEIKAVLSRQGFEEQWEMSYSYREEDLEMVKWLHDDSSEYPYRRGQVRVRRYRMDDGTFELEAHCEPDLDVHTDSFLKQIGFDVARGMDILRSALDAEGVTYTTYVPVETTASPEWPER